MRVDGHGLEYLCSPALFPRLKPYTVLVEFESGPLSALRFQKMVALYFNAMHQFRHGAHPRPEPRLLIFATGIRRSLRSAFQAFEDVGIFYTNYLGLHAYVVDTTAVPSDSSYSHLKLMHAPVAYSAEAFDAHIIERMKMAATYSTVPAPLLQELLMTTLKHLHDDPARQESIFRQSLPEAAARGRREGREEGRAEGRTEGRAEGREDGRAEGRADTLIRLAMGLAPHLVDDLKRETDLDAMERKLMAALKKD